MSDALAVEKLRLLAEDRADQFHALLVALDVLVTEMRTQGILSALPGDLDPTVQRWADRLAAVIATHREARC